MKKCGKTDSVLEQLSASLFLILIVSTRYTVAHFSRNAGPFVITVFPLHCAF